MNNVITDNAAMVAVLNKLHLLYRHMGTNRAILYSDESNANKESLTIEVCYCTDTGRNESLPALWYKRGNTPTRLATFWAIRPEAKSRYGDITVEYNPMVKGQSLDFAWVLEATPENLYKLLTEVKRRFLTCEK